MELENTDIINTEIEEYFQIGQKLAVVRLFTEDNESYPSYVKDVAEDAIFIDIPTKFGVRVPVYEEDILEIDVLTKDCAFSAQSVVLSVEIGKVEGLWITIPEVLEKVQRRDFKRWEIKFPLKVFVMNNDKVIEEISGESFDISGSGIAVCTKYTVPHNQDLKIKFQHKDLSVDLKVKFVHLRYDVVRKVYVTGLKFIDIDRKTTDKIHKLGILFELELRRKGLI